MFKVALLSRWHAHGQSPDNRYAKELLAQPDCQVVCVWDPDPTIAKEWGEEYGVPYYTDLQALLARADVDGVLVTSNPIDHRQILIAAAEAGKHIFTEKVLSLSLDDANAIMSAVKRCGVKFCISFNRMAIKQLAYAKNLLDSGTLGRPVYFRCMCTHDLGFRDILPSYWYDPEITGGGAMIDMGFNSTYLARYIMGDMESVSALFSNSMLQKQVEDTAVCSIKFKNGAIGTIEASFCTASVSVFELELCCTAGTYYARFGGEERAELRIHEKPNRLIPLEEIPEAVKSPVQTWVEACVNNGSDAVYGIDAAVDMVKFMLAAYRSANADGKREKI